VILVKYRRRPVPFQPEMASRGRRHHDVAMIDQPVGSQMLDGLTQASPHFVQFDVVPTA